jgi:hypothetical protein
LQSDPFQPFKKDSVDELIEFLTPVVDSILSRIDVDEFTTPDFIEAMLTEPVAESAYKHALAMWGEDEHSSKLVVHGQVIPGVLRNSPRVEWAGFAYGEPDEYAVPAWWRLVKEGDA